MSGSSFFVGLDWGVAAKGNQELSHMNHSKLCKPLRGDTNLFWLTFVLSMCYFHLMGFMSLSDESFSLAKVGQTVATPINKPMVQG